MRKIRSRSRKISKRKFPHFGIEIKRSDIHGFGVFATKYFGPGWFIGPVAGVVPEIPDSDCLYSIWYNDSRGRDTTFVPVAPFKYLNHTKEPNAELDNTSIYATDHIRPGEEITIYYGDGWDGKENKRNMRMQDLEEDAKVDEK